MADEPNPSSPTPPAGDAQPPTPPPAGEPSPAVVPPPTEGGGPQAEALSDGTVPTVLQKGDAAVEEKKRIKGGNGTLNSVYRRADIVTTLITFAGAIVIAGLIIGIYFYVTKSKAKPVVAPKVTTLDQTQLSKLGSFFGGNSAGADNQILTITSAALFDNRVGINSDLKVTGGLSVTGTTALAGLTVDSASTLAATNIRGTLTVVGPTNLQSPAVFSAGASINGNLAVSGSGSFGGSLSAGLINTATLSVTGTLNLAGHLAITGQDPSATPDAGAGPGATANVDGNDSAGTVTVNTGTIPNVGSGNADQLVKVSFHTPYAKVPRVIISPTTTAAAILTYYVVKTNTFFVIGTMSNATSSTGYSFDYWVVQ